MRTEEYGEASEHILAFYLNASKES